MAIEYESRKPIDPFQRTNPVLIVIVAIIAVLLIIIAARYIRNDDSEPQPDIEPQEIEQPPQDESAPPEAMATEPAAETPQSRPLTAEDLQAPDFSNQDVELPEIL